MCSRIWAALATAVRLCSLLNEARTAAQVTLVIQHSRTLSCVQDSSAGQEGLSLWRRATGLQECVRLSVRGGALDSCGLHFPYADPMGLFLLLLGFIFSLFIYFGCWAMGWGKSVTLA